MPIKLGDPGLSSNITGFSWNRLPTFATSSSEFLAFSQETFSTKIITTDQGELSHEEDNLKLNVLRKSTTPFKSDIGFLMFKELIIGACYDRFIFKVRVRFYLPNFIRL